MVESTVSRALNSKSASPPLRGTDSVKSFVQLRGLRPPVLPTRLRRYGRNFDPPERGACAPLPPALPPTPSRSFKQTDGRAGGSLTPKAGQQGMVGEALASQWPCVRDRASATTRQSVIGERLYGAADLNAPRNGHGDDQSQEIHGLPRAGSTLRVRCRYRLLS